MHRLRQRPACNRTTNRIRRVLTRFCGYVGLIGCGYGWSEPTPANVLDYWYAGIGLGWSYADVLELDAPNASMDLDQGAYQLLGTLGRRFGNDWRLELEYTQFAHDPELLYSSSAGIEVDPDDRDEVKASSQMLNVVRDFRIGQAWRPYLGAGVGRGSLDVRFSELEIDLPSFQRPRRDIIDDSDTGFAWQFIAGFTVPLSRRLDLAADFRYWQMPDVSLEDVNGMDLDTRHSIRSAWLQLKYHGREAGAFASPLPRPAVERGWYVTGSVGGAFAQDEDIEDQLLVIDAFELGPTTALALGYHLRPRWRVELEAGYQKNDVEVMEFSKTIGEDSASGSVESYSLMLNVILQFAPGSTIRPFVGFGGGWIRSSYHIRTVGFCRHLVCDPVERKALLVDDEGTAGAAQAMVGVDVAISERLRFSAAIRGLISGTTDMERPDGTPFNSERRNTTSVTAGVRYDLGK